MTEPSKYDSMLRLAGLFDSAGDEMRERCALGAEILADEAYSESAELAPVTFGQSESDIIDATSGRHGLIVRSVELDADALVLRATVLTYRWIDDLQEAAYRTLGSIAARAVGYLAPEVALGGAIFSAGLIETESLDRAGLTAYLNELAEANPELMDHFVSGGGGLLDGLQLRALLTSPVLAGPDGPAVARGGLRAVGAPAFVPDFAAGLRDIAGGYADPAAPAPADTPAPAEADLPRSLEELMSSLGQVGSELLVQHVGGGRFIAYLPHGDPRADAPLRLVAGDNTARLASVVAALEAATAGTDGARVMLVGHAHGGVTAAELAAAAGSPSFTIDQVVTAGAPLAQVPRIPESTTLLALEDRADPVALLGSLINAAVPNRLTVVFDGGVARGAAAYVAGGRAADRADHPELRAAIKRIQELGYLAS